jgi:hypothetical protein
MLEAALEDPTAVGVRGELIDVAGERKDECHSLQSNTLEKPLDNLEIF